MNKIILRSTCSRFIKLINKRCIYSVDGKWPKEYTLNLSQEIEARWRPILEENQKLYSENDKIRETLPKKYVLSMFPYPSGRLHMGHIRIYTLSDVLARFYRMLGFYVIHPIGWDAFGLPAENAAIEKNVKPQEWTKSNVDYMRNQLKEMSYSFDWNRELFTCEPSYYKWTQYLFLKLLEKGLAYPSEAIVNWDPVDKTVLAYEQIDENGKSWRSGAVVEKKYLRQWFVKSTAYSKSLLDALNDLETEDWESIKQRQRAWIGKCDGCLIDFKLTGIDEKFSIFTKKPCGIYGISHILVTNENVLIQKHYPQIKEGQQLPCFAINPITQQKIPIFYENNADYGIKDAEKFVQNSKLGIPCIDELDKQYATSKGLSYTKIIETKGENEIYLTNSENLNGLDINKAFDVIMAKLRELSVGGYLLSEKLKDWVVSRQRYWGTPCPIIYCEKCKIVPVPYEDLPVQLPIVDKLSNKGSSQLTETEWHKTKCPKCKGDATRETDTFDTFVDSSWYFLRYLDVNNNKEPFDKNLAAKFMPVDIYVGGAEHAITHLFVSRFVSHFLYDQKLLPTREPFQRFIAMGMVNGESFRKKDGRYIEPKYAIKKGDEYIHKETGELLTRNMEKMSKSKLNGIDPHEVIQEYGVDFTRLFLLGFVHPRTDRDFILAKDMVDGTLNIFKSIWSLVGSAIENKDGYKTKRNISANEIKKWNEELYKIRNSSISMLTYNLTGNFNLPSYIVAITKLVKFLKRMPVELHKDEYLKSLVEVLIMISPAVPHFANECWYALKENVKITQFDTSKLITEQQWPRLSDEYTLYLDYSLGKKEGKIKITAKQMETLDMKTALDLLKKQKDFDKYVTQPIEEHRTQLRVRYPYKANLKINEKKPLKEIKQQNTEETDEKS